MLPSLLFLLIWNFFLKFEITSHGYMLSGVNPRRLYRHFRCNAAPAQRFTVKSPLDCEIRSVRQIGGNGIDRSFYHIVIDHQGQYSFAPGQYCGILPPGVSSRTNRRHAPRSYSLAPVLNDDGVDGSRCFSLGIRAPIVAPGERERFRDICICSQFLSTAGSGTPVQITGPFGKFVLSPEDLNGETNLLLIATGTGVVPYMGYLDTLLKSHRLGSKHGKILLVFGVQSPDTYLYRAALEKYVSEFYGRLQVLVSYSRHGAESERGYVQDMLLKERRLVQSVCGSDGRSCSIFICGRKSMEKAVLSSLGEVFSQHPDLDCMMSNIKVEVYE